MGKSPTITIVGEVLYDCFPDGEQIPGGAPFNVAWNLGALGCHSHFVSAVGNDTLGAELLSLADQWGLDIRGIQRLPEKATGIVDVMLKRGIPRFSIRENAAFDHLETPKISDSERSGVLYHGSLICRSGKSEQTIAALRRAWTGPVFVDINIRDPWFDLKRFEPFLRKVDFLKLNDDEYERLAGHALNREAPIDAMKSLMDHYGVRNLIVTCGASGSYWCDGISVYRQEASDKLEIADTVGAGDAFASVCLNGITKGWSVRKTLKCANAFAEKVCTLQGATTSSKAFYKAALRSTGSDS